MKKEDKMKIRKAMPKDLKAIDEIYKEGVVDEFKTQFPKKTKASILREVKKSWKNRSKEWRKGMKSPKEYWLVAEIDGMVVGFAESSIDKKDKKKGSVDLIYIKKEFRRKGIGKKLTKERLKWLKSKGVKSISAKAYIKNKPTINNLKNLGFEVTAVRLYKTLK